MKHSYVISGMTCANCSAKVKGELLKLPDVLSAEVELATGKATIEMQKHISNTELQNAVSAAGKYTISPDATDTSHHAMENTSASWFAAYKPILLVFAFITGVTILIQLAKGAFDLTEWMRHFMAGFFLVFSFFKLLDLKGFADSYSSYDIVAKRVYTYGYVYPFIESALGISFLFPALSFWSNLFTLIVMAVSIIGVLQSVLNKRQIQCACLGTVFNLPMSTITIIEDGLMIAMSAASLLMR